MQKVSIYSLSKSVGVSPSSVSKALNNSADISLEMRKKIQTLAKQMNFKPRVVRRRAVCIGVLIQQETGAADFGAYLDTILEGIVDYCHEEGLAISIIAAPADELNQYDLVKELARRGIDSVVVLQSNSDSRYLEQLEKGNYPYFVVNGDAPDPQKSIITDYYFVGKNAAEYFNSQEHSHVGMIVSPANSAAGIRRLQGFSEHIKGKLTIARNTDFSGEDEKDFRGGTVCCASLLEKDPEISAIFVTGLEPCLGAFHELRERKIAVPEQISLLSCDDYKIMNYMCPRLSTVNVPIAPLGYHAAKQVYRLFRGLALQKVTAKLKLKGEIIIRDTTKQF